MIHDPYQILGVSKDATQDEIKRAYRKKAKECHPDLHPDDPTAHRRMQDVNEAYDMLMNPEKYHSRPQGNPYGQQGGSYGSQGSPYGQGNPYGQQSWGGWSPFDDLFGGAYSYGYGAQTPPPREQPGDSEEIRRAIYFINMRQYANALPVLNGIPAGMRSARWYYLTALTHRGMGNLTAAMEHIERAVQLDPANGLYQQLMAQYRRAGQTYTQNGRGYNTTVFDPSKICMGLCLSQLCCRFFFCC